MKISLHSLPDATVEAITADTAERQELHQRNNHRDAIIASLEAALNVRFNFGGWEEISHLEMTQTSVVRTLGSLGWQCRLIGGAWELTLHTDDVYDMLFGSNPDGAHVELDITALLEFGELVTEGMGEQPAHV